MTECEKYQEMISAMLDGELAESGQEELRRHMDGCPECRNMYEAFAAVSGTMRSDGNSRASP